jgi:hypothetical protein
MRSVSECATNRPNKRFQPTSTLRCRSGEAAAEPGRWGAGKASQRFPIEPMTTQGLPTVVPFDKCRGFGSALALPGSPSGDPERHPLSFSTWASVSCGYVRYINTSYRRTGTLWDSRYKSSLIQAETYLLTCMRYIELNPVRATMVEDPAHYRWTSYGANDLGQTSPLLVPHSV